MTNTVEPKKKRTVKYVNTRKDVIGEGVPYIPDTEEKTVAIMGLVALNADLKATAQNMRPEEARYLTQMYVDRQRDRIHLDNQRKTLKERGVGHKMLDWAALNAAIQEQQINLALGRFAKGSDLGRWALSICGIGPIIAGGLLSLIDISKIQNVSQAEAFCGLASNVEWLGREKAASLVEATIGKREPTYEDIAAIGQRLYRRPANIINTCRFIAKKQGVADYMPTRAELVKGLAMRPWSAAARVLLWKAGKSFTKIQNKPDGYYGHIYAERKAFEWEQNLSGQYAPTAGLKAKTYGSGTDALIWTSGRVTPDLARQWRAAEAEDRPRVLREGMLKPGEPGGVPMLSPAHIEARACRYASQKFLAHFVMVGLRLADRPVPDPYIIGKENHTKVLYPPNFDWENRRVIDDKSGNDD